VAAARWNLSHPIRPPRPAPARPGPDFAACFTPRAKVPQPGPV